MFVSYNTLNYSKNYPTFTHLCLIICNTIESDSFLVWWYTTPTPIVVPRINSLAPRVLKIPGFKATEAVPAYNAKFAHGLLHTPDKNYLPKYLQKCSFSCVCFLLMWGDWYGTWFRMGSRMSVVYGLCTCVGKVTNMLSAYTVWLGLGSTPSQKYISK